MNGSRQYEKSPVLSVRELSKSYGDYLALQGIDLDIDEGEFFCLLGPSGCGKSTLLNILAGFEDATEGIALYNGQAIKGPNRERIVFFQDANAALLPWLTVDENVRFALKLRQFPSQDWPDIITRYLSMVDLDSHRKKFPSQLSGGMLQRLQIARALAVEPDVLLMDEPFAALDAMTRRRMHQVLLDIRSRTGKTIVFVTHDIAEALTLATRIGVMSVGPASNFLKILPIRPADADSASTPVPAGIGEEIEVLLAPEMARIECRELGK